MATRSRRTHGATAEGTSAEIGELPPLSVEERSSDLASKGSAIAAGVLVVASLLPWVSVTFFSASALNGIRLWEGRITLVLAIVAGACALVAHYGGMLNRRNLLLASAVCGVLSFLAALIYGFRFRGALDLPAGLGSGQALGLIRAGAGLDVGWYLAMASSIVLTALAIWGYMNTRETGPAEAVPGMEWVEHGAHQGTTGDTGATSSTSTTSTTKQDLPGRAPGDQH